MVALKLSIHALVFESVTDIKVSMSYVYVGIYSSGTYVIVRENCMLTYDSYIATGKQITHSPTPNIVF